LDAAVRNCGHHNFNHGKEEHDEMLKALDEIFDFVDSH